MNDTTSLFNNPLAWGMYYAPEHFTDVSPTFHVEILNAALNYQYLAVVAPRGSSKSTLLTFLLPAWAIAFKKHHHIVLLQSTFEKSATSIATITELLRSELVQKDFKITLTKDTKGEAIFDVDGFKVRIIGKGAEQMSKIRGEKFNAWRPNLIIIDDLEDDVTAKNQELRLQTRTLFDRAVVKSVDKAKHQIIAIGTIFHDDCLISRLINKDYYPDYKKLFYQVRMKDDFGQEYSLWPERWSIEEIQQEELDDPDTFSTEMMNNPSSGAASKFRKEDFRTWRMAEGQYLLYDGGGTIISKGLMKDCVWGIACDLAWEERRTSDFSVAMPGFLTPQNEILVDTYLCKKGLRPDELFEWLFVAVDRLIKITGSVGHIGFEKAKLEKVIKWLLEKEMRKRGKFLLLKDLVWDADKLQRIYTRLQPRYSQHVIYHQKGMEELEYQLIRIPSGTHDDLCLAQGTKIATPFGNKNIEDVTVGDYVITPIGNRKVLACGFTGVKNTLDIGGLSATPDHKIFSNNSCFVSADTIQYGELNRLTVKELLLWRYRKLLSLMELPTGEWAGRESIICLSQIQMQGGSVRKDFMWRFGNFITKQQFLKAGTFTISTVTLSIMTLITFIVYRLANILRCRKNTIKRLIKDSWRALGSLLRSGIVHLPVGNGTKNTLLKSLRNVFPRHWYVPYAEGTLLQKINGVNSVPKNAEIGKSGLSSVYNLTVQDDGVYYANGILVSNCDAAQGLCQLLSYPKDSTKSEKKQTAEDEFNWWRKQAIDKNKPEKKAYNFGRKDRDIAIPFTRSYR